MNILFLAKTSEEKVGQDEVLEQVDVRLWPDPGEEREEGGQHQQSPWGHHQGTGNTQLSSQVNRTGEAWTVRLLWLGQLATF